MLSGPGGVDVSGPVLKFTGFSKVPWRIRDQDISLFMFWDAVKRERKAIFQIVGYPDKYFFFFI